MYEQKLSEITDDLDSRVRPVFERVSNQNQEITSLKAEVCSLVSALGRFQPFFVDRAVE